MESPTHRLKTVILVSPHAWVVLGENLSTCWWLMEEQQRFHTQTALRRTNSVWRKFPPLLWPAQKKTHGWFKNSLGWRWQGRKEGQGHTRGSDTSQGHITLQWQGHALGRHHQLGRARQPPSFGLITRFFYFGHAQNKDFMVFRSFLGALFSDFSEEWAHPVWVVALRTRRGILRAQVVIYFSFLGFATQSGGREEVKVCSF